MEQPARGRVPAPTSQGARAADFMALTWLGEPSIFRGMNWDISYLLDQWEYHPGQVMVRTLKGKDGMPKIQLRVDLGLLQMNAEGRPDGKKPFGHESLFEHHKTQLTKYEKAHEGEDDGFS